MNCRICNNSENNKLHTFREMHFGTREEFKYIECRQCGTIQIAEIPDLSLHYPSNYYSYKLNEINFSPKLLSRIVAKLAASYFISKRNVGGKYISKLKPWTEYHFPEFLRENFLNLSLNSKILDFGCGAGDLLSTLKYYGFNNLTGADFYIEKDIFYQNGVNIYKRELKDFSPFFDLIMLHHSFEHLLNPHQILQEIHRLLNPSKYCLIRIPVISFAWKYYKNNWVQLDAPRHIHLFTEKGVQILAEKNGFTIEKIVYDSTFFQFWGSEQYLLDIPLFDERSMTSNQNNPIFNKDQIEEWKNQAIQLNEISAGDQACFYLRKL